MWSETTTEGSIMFNRNDVYTTIPKQSRRLNQWHEIQAETIVPILFVKILTALSTNDSGYKEL